MKTPAELADRLRKMVLAAQHHYSPTGEPLRSIVVTPEWLEDMADAANKLQYYDAVYVSEDDGVFDPKKVSLSVAKLVVSNPDFPAAFVTEDGAHEGVSQSISDPLPVGTPIYTKPVCVNKF